MSSMAGTDSVFASKESGVTGQVPEAEVNVNEEILKVSIVLIENGHFMEQPIQR